MHIQQDLQDLINNSKGAIAIIDDCKGDFGIYSLYEDRKFIKLPKQMAVDLAWYYAKLDIGKALNYANMFHRLNIGRLGQYGTTRGLSLWQLFNREFEEDCITIENYLKKNDIKFKTEWSDARYVFRFVFSQTQENIAKIKKLTQKGENDENIE